MRKIKFHVNHNECGDCRVCCTTFPFTDKAQWADEYNEVPHYKEKYNLIYSTGKPCNQLCSTGCSIHHDKPRICKEFWCDYLKWELPGSFYRFHTLLEVLGDKGQEIRNYVDLMRKNFGNWCPAKIFTRHEVVDIP